MIRIIVTDDHHLIRSGFAKLIDQESDMELIGEASGGGELMDLLETCSCDVLVLDISLPDKSGLEVLKDVLFRYPSIKILILSMHPEELYAVRAMKDGACGYITKSSAPEELVRAIRKIFRGGMYLSNKLAQQLALTLTSDTVPLHEQLSDREYQVLIAIGAGMAVHEIAEQCCLSVNTINTYRRRVLKKLHLHSTAELIQYGIQHNLIEQIPPGKP
jgi:DNA-binding NarL/FixJ family response regulator